MIKLQDLGEVVYGGAVATTEWWDNKRITEGSLAEKEIWKKASFWTYLGIGLPSTLISAFGWWKGGEPWLEHISHGFFYDLPRFVWGLVRTMSTQSKTKSSSEAVKEANRILAEANKRAKQLGAGTRLGRTYQEEFEQVSPYAF